MVGRQAYSQRNQVSLIANGEDFIEKCIEAIKGAQSQIKLHTYIFEEDEISNRIIKELEQKSNEGVKVFLLFDAFASPELSADLKERFKRAGINWAFFAPILSRKFEHYGRRLHQKVLIIDNSRAITGGINLAKKFIAPKSEKPWLDYAIDLRGEEVARLQRKTMWLYLKYFPEHRSIFKQKTDKASTEPGWDTQARTLVNDFMRFRTEIHQSYIQALREAKSSVKITATYFLPGKRFMRELKKASRRGVQIELIFGKRSDHTLERWSSRYLYSWYLKHGIKVYEWSDSILHAKAALIDNAWVSIGSYNHNYISRYACLELNIEVLNKEFASKMDQEFEKIKERSEIISKKDWHRPSRRWASMVYFFTYALSNVVTFISLLFIFRSKEKGELR